MREEIKGRGIDPPSLTDTENAIRHITEKLSHSESLSHHELSRNDSKIASKKIFNISIHIFPPYFFK